MQFLTNVIISGKIHCKTGLRIGGTIEGFEIGGMDNPVLRDPVTGYPYIPGSSIKGKMRSQMEWATPGKITLIKDKDSKKKDGDVHSCSESDCPICRVYGASAAEVDWKGGPTRLTVRDAYPTEETKKQMDLLEREKGLPKVEWKTENTINRITAHANPRPMERVPASSEFLFEMIYGIYDTGDRGETDQNNLKQVFKALQLLQDSSLGGCGSRGSGKILFLIRDKIIIRKVSDYESMLPQIKPGTYKELSSINPEEIISQLKE